jgi:hypothetical protein
MAVIAAIRKCFSIVSTELEKQVQGAISYSQVTCHQQLATLLGVG